ncbi:hypothetical protein [Flagellimonas amoyensis]|uniref:hypothetical protein n=1 Tax=Flagellimonas amoyensis TaxID=2169401 RepID=UPI000D39604B|nr:hypothetical protein [Allomuricauda amoyensis]
MKLASAVAANSLVFEVDVPSQGLLFGDDLPEGAKIKVDLIQPNANDVNRIPELPIVDIFDINNYLGFDGIINKDVAGGLFKNYPVVIFAHNGVLPFDDDVKYKVTLTELDGATFDVFNIDNQNLASTPVVIKKAEVKQTTAEKMEHYKDVDFLLFNGATDPTKLSFLVNDRNADGTIKVRKVEISHEQMSAYMAKHEITQYDTIDGIYSNGLTSLGFPISELDAITIHHDTAENEDLKYLTVDYKLPSER